MYTARRIVFVYMYTFYTTSVFERHNRTDIIGVRQVEADRYTATQDKRSRCSLGKSAIFRRKLMPYAKGTHAMQERS